MMEYSDPHSFFELQAKFDKVPFTQSEAWYDYLKVQGKKIVFFMDRPKDPSIMTWGFTEKIPVFGGKILRIEGECFHSLPEQDIAVFYKELSNSNYTAIEINSNNVYSTDFEIGIRKAGFCRPIGSFSCPLTIELNLEEEISFNRNWKRNVKQAKESKLKFVEVVGPENDTIQHILSLFREMAELKQLGYQLSVEALTKLVNSECIKTFMAYSETGEPLAARIIHVRDGNASDVIAANSNKARVCGATFFLMQKVFENLKSKNVKLFDFGRIPPSNHSSNNVYLFKNSVRGIKVQYNGEWSFYKNKRIELAVFMYKWLKIKKQRY